MAEPASVREGIGQPADAEVRRLENLLLDIDADVAQWERAHDDAERRMAETARARAGVVSAQEQWQPTVGSAFEMRLDGAEAADRGGAGRLLIAWARADREYEPDGRHDRSGTELCRLGGVPVELAVRAVEGVPSLVLSVRNVPGTEAAAKLGELGMRGVAMGLIRRLEGQIRRLPELEGRIDRDHAAAAGYARRAGDEIDRLSAQWVDRSADLARAGQRPGPEVAELAAAQPTPQARPDRDELVDGQAKAVAATNFPRAAPRSSQGNRARLTRDVEDAQHQLVAAHDRVSAVRGALETRERMDGFAMTVGDVRTPDRVRAAQLLDALVTASWEHYPAGLGRIGRLNGLEVAGEFRYQGAEPHIFLSVARLRETEVGMPLSTLDSGGVELIEALERQIAALPQALDEAERARTEARAKLDACRQALAGQSGEPANGRSGPQVPGPRTENDARSTASASYPDRRGGAGTAGAAGAAGTADLSHNAARANGPRTTPTSPYTGVVLG